jgi:hypothetical protein
VADYSSCTNHGIVLICFSFNGNIQSDRSGLIALEMDKQEHGPSRFIPFEIKQ